MDVGFQAAGLRGMHKGALERFDGRVSRADDGRDGSNRGGEFVDVRIKNGAAKRGEFKVGDLPEGVDDFKGSRPGKIGGVVDRPGLNVFRSEAGI